MIYFNTTFCSHWTESQRCRLKQYLKATPPQMTSSTTPPELCGLFASAIRLVSGSSCLFDGEGGSITTEDAFYIFFYIYLSDSYWDWRPNRIKWVDEPKLQAANSSTFIWPQITSATHQKWDYIVLWFWSWCKFEEFEIYMVFCHFRFEMFSFYSRHCVLGIEMVSTALQRGDEQWREVFEKMRDKRKKRKTLLAELLS